MMMLGVLTMVAGLVYTPVMAQDTEEEEEQEEKVVTIPDMLKEVKYVTKVKPKKKAVIYYFLRSHSKCGPCVALTGANNEAYKEMKGKGAELIMLNGDADTEAAKAWAEKAGMIFPVITPETKGNVNVPSGGSGGTPNMVVVTADGTVLKDTSGMNKCKTLLSEWKDLVKEGKKVDREKRKEAEGKKKSKKKKSKKKKSKPADAEAAEPAEEDIDLEL